MGHSRNLLNKAAGKLVCLECGTAIPEPRKSETAPPPSSPAPAAPRSRQKTRRAVGKEHFVANFNYPTRRLTDRRD